MVAFIPGRCGIYEGEPKIKQVDAVKIIAYLQTAWKAAKSTDEQQEISRLVDTIREVAGMKKMNV